MQLIQSYIARPGAVAEWDQLVEMSSMIQADAINYSFTFLVSI
jgi:hypothetical protein